MAMFPLAWQPVRRAVVVLVAVVGLAGCAALTETPPAPTPADFGGIAELLVRSGVRIDHVVAGDAGCDDVGLARTAIAFDASGLDQAVPTRVYLYIFRDRATFERLRQSVDTCARSYVTDAASFESIDSSPYVVAGPGPWSAGFRAAIRAAVGEAAGTGG